MNTRKLFLLSIRHLIADKVNTVINVAGLAIALGVVTVVLVYVLNEFGYNSSFSKRDRIYRIIENPIQDKQRCNTPYVLGATLKEMFAEVEADVYSFSTDFEMKQEDGEYIQEKWLTLADGDFFTMFDVQMIEGSVDGFDEISGQLFICRSLAEKHFGNESAVGKTVTVMVNSKQELVMTVAGVFEDFAQNTTMPTMAVANINIAFDVLMNNMVTVSNGFTVGSEITVDDMKTGWNFSFLSGYLLLHEGTDVQALTEKINLFSKERNAEMTDEPVEEDETLTGEKAKEYITYSLQPMKDIYFGSVDIFGNSAEQGNRRMIFILIATGIAILLIACINYLNLTFAQAFSQTKNMAVNKVFGASRSSLVGQRVFESTLVALVALPFAAAIAQNLLPATSRLLEKEYSLTLGSNFVLTLAGIVAVTLFTGVVSGLFVSLRATSFNLTVALKGKKGMARNRRISLMNVMIVFQIAIFIILLSSVFLMKKQIGYALTADLGIDREGLLRIPVKDVNYEVFKQEVVKNTNVTAVSGGMFIPPGNFNMQISLAKMNNPEEYVMVNAIFVDYGFMETMGIALLSGNDFVKGSKNYGLLVNRSAIEQLGLTDVIGEKTQWGEVRGVMADFNISSMHSAIPPMIMGINTGAIREIAVRINTLNMPETISFIEETWKKSGAVQPFTYSFTDDVLRRYYEADIRFSHFTALLAFVAVFIACMGLFGLSMLVSRQRTKETGIRKVNGATVAEVLTMLNSRFVYLVAAAFVIATPVAWFAMQKWFDGFAYRTPVSWWIFVLAGIAALVIVLITVSLHSLHTARRNPVEALRYE